MSWIRWRGTDKRTLCVSVSLWHIGSVFSKRSVLSTLAVAMIMFAARRAPGFAPWQPAQGGTLPMYGYTVQHVYPHDPDAFTQGLQFLDGVLFEGTGLTGRSSSARRGRCS